MALLIGSLASVGIFLGRSAISDNNKEQSARLEDKTLTKKQIQALVNRVVAVESPSREEFLAAVQRAFKICSASPECRKTFAQATKRAGIGVSAEPQVPPHTVSSGGPNEKSRPKGSAPPQRSRTPNRKRPNKPGNSPSPGAPPATQTTPQVEVPGHPPPSTPLPPPIITVPLPHICDPLIYFNCPPPG